MARPRLSTQQTILLVDLLRANPEVITAYIPEEATDRLNQEIDFLLTEASLRRLAKELSLKFAKRPRKTNASKTEIKLVVLAKTLSKMFVDTPPHLAMIISHQSAEKVQDAFDQWNPK